ncbi:DinB family protein [Fulvivirgaceae bacterium BMA12]|uniref:DinB family protein n=1 Tax=Agaribacillus aureus TaxID=3051825 RepID=A0ABT8KYX2_9BACT|nr:DinB family protein [Fulvivirgaceae bacterium BMA12]
MNKILSLFIAAACLLVSYHASAQTGLTDSDRDFAFNHLKQSQKKLQKVVKGLSDTQLNFKASPESWSIAECVEHMAISESVIFSFIEGSLKTAADPSLRSEVKMTDEQIIQLTTDRSTKVQTREVFEPKHSFGSFQGALDEFNNRRKSSLKYVKSTKDDLRNHYFDFPFGKADSFQVLLFMSGHSIRHIKQIEEILATPTFPSS